jgi:uncharacterized coiled-coil protein SlyX
MFKWKIRGGPSSYGGASRAANDGGAGAGVTIHTYILTYIYHTINDNKVGRRLMHLEMFIAAEANLRDDQITSHSQTLARHDQAIARLDRLVDYTVSRVGD